MFITPRTYSASQTPDRISVSEPPNYPRRLRFRSLVGWNSDPVDSGRNIEMLLIRQAGTVRVGEVVRYTLTYNPAADGAQPSAAALYVRIKNTSPAPLRAAYLHGPYTLYTSCYPSSFDPNGDLDSSSADNVPQFEPYLKAGATWSAVIPIPMRNKQEGPSPARSPNGRVSTWIIEIISQVVFSSTASVNFEVLVGRDETSLDLPSRGQSQPPRAASLRDHWPTGSKGKQLLATKGVYSESITLRVDDTASLWNTPHLPTSQNEGPLGSPESSSFGSSEEPAGVTAAIANSLAGPAKEAQPKKIHLVVLTHGLHSNLGADMLYLKESIDAASRRTSFRPKSQVAESGLRRGMSPSNSCSVRNDDRFREDQAEQVVVRGFPGNATRTERGIQYLGKRLAKYVLLMTSPDQAHLPHQKVKARTYPEPFSSWGELEGHGQPKAETYTNADRLNLGERRAYQITSISFIGHSLGGLVQTYAIAYIQKYSPYFFETIKPINFIALATPFLGLSNENPIYVRFALDFGLVGRTGQDLGLRWTAPRAGSSWETIIGGKGGPSKSSRHAEAKPLLRILPSGPAHDALTKFRRRTIYSNLVNDGIVPLRTSCLLFLDWKGLERVEKARRENGIVGTMAEWGWAELTGANSKSPGLGRSITGSKVTGASNGIAEPFERTSIEMNPHGAALGKSNPSPSCSSSPAGGISALRAQPLSRASCPLANAEIDGRTPQSPSSPLGAFIAMFKPKDPGHKQGKILMRNQTTDLTLQGNTHYNHRLCDIRLNAPPQTTVFESAGDILMPPLPPIEYIVDPASRPRTIFHDRIYHPEDIPPVLVEQGPQLLEPSHDNIPANQPSVEGTMGKTGLKVEEKIARAYHRGLSWRKVLVRLEPDAHNNIIVRRMFANAYGWPVVQHLVDAHFTPMFSTNLGDASEDVRECPTQPIGKVEDIHNFTRLSSTVPHHDIV
ncbi:lipase ROG1 family protein [Aspergillus lucknowensis]|uniref:Serine esterase-domain-containing protein n=1 Tax=Aspergillus lucknowensis TaxID=176173 RepID=A0ABR4LI34_9EURO